MPKLLRRKNLRAATARRSAGGSAEMDYGEMSEPNMKLSRALLIVLLLHVVAVSGIVAFNAIKTRQSSFASGARGNTEDNSTPKSVGPTVRPVTSSPKSELAQKENVPRAEAKTSRPVSKSLAKDEHAKSAAWAT